MPKSKVRKKNEYVAPVRSQSSAAIRQSAPSAPWYPFVMVAVMLLGLAWIAVFYIAGDRIPFMVSLNAWNYAIGFALLVGGLLMAARWR